MNINILASWFVFLSVVLFFVGLLIKSNPDYCKKNSRGDIWRKISEKIGPVIVPIFPVANIENIKNKIVWAGEPYSINYEQFIGIKVLFLAGGILVGLFLITLNFPALFIIILLLLFVLPDIFLSEAVKKRKRKIRKDMPNMIALLATAIKAGVEIGPALQTVGNKMTGPLGNEIRTSWKEMATGKPRAITLRDMAKRTGVNDVERFVETIITALERGGLDLSNILVFMNNIRESQKNKAREEARKIPTKMLLPLIVCVFLPMLVIILTPIVFQLLEVL